MARPRKFDEAEVIASAGRTFAATGYAGTSLDDLMAATGLGRQSLYNAFGGKRELFMRAFLSDAKDAAEAVDEAVRNGNGSPIERIRAHLLKLAIALGSEESRPSLFTKAAVELSDHDADVASSVLKAFTEMEESYRSCVIEAQDSGEVETGADPGALAAFFLALIEGMETLGSAGVSRARLTAAALTSFDALPLTPVGRQRLTSAAGEPGEWL
jgi:AcrR family transcriptional regulator